MNYIRELETNKGLRASLKKIFRDIDRRLKAKEGEGQEETPSEPVEERTETSIALDVDDTYDISEDIVITPLLYYYDETNDEDIPLENETVALNITFSDESELSLTETTDNEGYAIFNVESESLVSGEATVTARFAGNSTYAPSEYTVTTTITDNETPSVEEEDNTLTINGTEYELIINDFEANGQKDRSYAQVVHFSLKSTTGNEYLTEPPFEDGKFGTKLFVNNENKHTYFGSYYTTNGNDISIDCGGTMSSAYLVEEGDNITFMVIRAGDDEIYVPNNYEYENTAEISWVYHSEEP